MSNVSFDGDVDSLLVNLGLVANEEFAMVTGS